MKPKYKIGTRFSVHRKVRRTTHVRTCTVTDILTTTNSAGDVVKIRYVAVHEFMGQPVVDHDVLETTISMGFIGARSEQADHAYWAGFNWGKKGLPAEPNPYISHDELSSAWVEGWNKGNESKGRQDDSQ